MLHETKNEDGIKNFFTEMYDTYIKVRIFLKPVLLSQVCSLSYDRSICQILT